MLIVTVDPEVLLESLIHPLGLAIAFQMIARGEMKSDIEGLTKGAEKVRDKLHASIGGDVRGNSMLREDMEKEELCELRRCNRVVGWNEYALFRQMVNDHKDGGKSGGRRELFDEVHRNGVPWLLGDRELF